MDSVLMSAIAGQLGSNQPPNDAKLAQITELQVAHAESLTGLERCRGLEILIMTGCDAASAPLANMSSLSVVISRDSALEELASFSTSVNVVELMRNRVVDLSPLLRCPHLMRLDVTGNPLSDESYEMVIPELLDRGVKIVKSGEREQKINKLMYEMGLPYSYYRSGREFRLCRPGLRLTSFPERNHPIIPPDALERKLEEQPASVAELFEQ
ncbi:hypothetical protein ACMA1D_13595 [Streptomyces sp. 796.1]|uniref:hypothetical protein n=1 Tax=Streptomyces sp. 796.1 TaxID=3163029 RepID=UPI0039C9CB69